eukprot:9755762-Alexandrium_andersonii.AAC.1
MLGSPSQGPLPHVAPVPRRGVTFSVRARQTARCLEPSWATLRGGTPPRDAPLGHHRSAARLCRLGVALPRSATPP